MGRWFSLSMGFHQKQTYPQGSTQTWGVLLHFQDWGVSASSGTSTQRQPTGMKRSISSHLRIPVFDSTSDCWHILTPMAIFTMLGCSSCEAIYFRWGLSLDVIRSWPPFESTQDMQVMLCELLAKTSLRASDGARCKSSSRLYYGLAPNGTGGGASYTAAVESVYGTVDFHYHAFSNQWFADALWRKTTLYR